MTYFTPATSAFSWNAGAHEAIQLLKANTFDDVADILERSLQPDDLQNGVMIDKDAFMRGVVEGIACVRQFAASNKLGAWPSQSSEEDLTEVEECLLAGYFGA